MKELIKVIAFDADDTLWSNEPFFQEIEKQYTDLLKPYGTSVASIALTYCLCTSCKSRINVGKFRIRKVIPRLY